MNIVPPAVEQRINRVDRTPSLVIGIVCAVIALGCVWGLLWSIYGALVLTEYGFSPVALIVNVVLYVVFGGAALIGAVGFLTHYRSMETPPPPAP
jgi:ABC-type uncharacterized transport system fused permease/ATPase subunit